MNKNKYSDEDILTFLNRSTRGESIKAICVDAGISLATFYNWRNKFFHPETDADECEKQLIDENESLRNTVKRLHEEKQMLLDALKSRR